MDADVVAVPADASGRLTHEALRATVAELDDAAHDRVFAIVATSGTTNAGVIDDLAAAAAAAAELGAWLHVDGAYGGAALAAPSVRHRFAGIEAADSFIVDPHKWLFAPFDSCALLYRDPEVARRPTPSTPSTSTCCTPTSRSTAAGGTPPTTPTTSAAAPAACRSGSASPPTAPTPTPRPSRPPLPSPGRVPTSSRAAPHLELLVEPELSVVLFRRVGWGPAEYAAWSDGELARGHAFVTPSAWAGETVLRWCIVNPLTTVDDLASLVDSLAGG